MTHAVIPPEFVSTINSMARDFGDEAQFGGGECHRV